jgi:hypothetical protein
LPSTSGHPFKPSHCAHPAPAKGQVPTYNHMSSLKPRRSRFDAYSCLYRAPASDLWGHLTL